MLSLLGYDVAHNINFNRNVQNILATKNTRLHLFF
jgi:hypothetical protein